MSRIFVRIAGALAAVALGSTLAACQVDGAVNSDGPAPSVSKTASSSSQSPTSSSADPAETAIEERAAAAEQRFREFLEIRDEHAKKSRDPFEKLLNNGYLGSDDAQKVEQSLWAQYTELRLKQVGAMQLASVEMTDYEGDPLVEGITGHRVHFEVCMDSSNYDVVRPDGSSAVEPGPSRELRQVVMQGQPTGTWSVSGYVSANKEC